MTTNQRSRIVSTLGKIAGGLLAVSFLPMAVASADEIIQEPDLTTLIPSQVTGDPPYSPQVITGTESWSNFDITTDKVSVPDVVTGVDTHTLFGSFVNDDIAFSNGSSEDFTNFGGGFANYWVDIPSGPDAGMSDLLITPFGDFPLFGPDV